MNNVRNTKRLGKACIGCSEVTTCSLSSEKKKKCYQHYYNTTQRNKAAERIRIAKYRENNYAKWILAQFKSKAKKKGIPFDLDLEWITKELERGTCEVTGIPFELSKYKKGNVGVRGPWAPSVDRIDNNKGYTKDNCRIVVWIFNLSKNNYSNAAVLRFCIAIVAKSITENSTIHNQAFVSFFSGLYAASIAMPSRNATNLLRGV